MPLVSPVAFPSAVSFPVETSVWLPPSVTLLSSELFVLLFALLSVDVLLLVSLEFEVELVVELEVEEFEGVAGSVEVLVLLELLELLSSEVLFGFVLFAISD